MSITTSGSSRAASLWPSPQVLDALASALLLDGEQRVHLRELAAAAAQGEHAPSVPNLFDFGPLLRAIQLPAFAQNRFMDVLDVNATAPP